MRGGGGGLYIIRALSVTVLLACFNSTHVEFMFQSPGRQNTGFSRMHATIEIS